MSPEPPRHQSSVFGPVRRALLHEYWAAATTRNAMVRRSNMRRFIPSLYEANRRVCALQTLLLRRGLPIPRDPRERSSVGPPVPSGPANTAVSTNQASRAVALYDQLLSRELPPDVKEIFSRLRQGSLDQLAGPDSPFVRATNLSSYDATVPR